MLRLFPRVKRKGIHLQCTVIMMIIIFRMHDCVCTSRLKVTVDGTTNSGPSEIGTQYNRPSLYTGLTSSRSENCFHIVLIQFEPQKGYRST